MSVLDMFEFLHVEVEDGLVSGMQKEGRVWRYELNASAFTTMHSITVLFRGSEDEILSEFLYGALLVDGVCVDLLKQDEDNDDERVKEFSAFPSENPFPCFAKSKVEIVLVFKREHTFDTDKIRVLADASCADEDMSDVYVRYTTPVAEFTVSECKLTIIKGDVWSLSLPGLLLQQEVDKLVVRREVLNPEDEDLPDTEMPTLFDRLDYIVAWKAQRELLESSLSSVNLRSGSDDSQNGNASSNVP